MSPNVSIDIDAKSVSGFKSRFDPPPPSIIVASKNNVHNSTSIFFADGVISVACKNNNEMNKIDFKMLFLSAGGVCNVKVLIALLYPMTHCTSRSSRVGY